MQNECKILVEKFKSDFDYLSTLSRFSEASFLSIYKALKDAFDPTNTISECLSVCLKSQEVMKRAQEQLNIASKLLSGSSSAQASSSNSANSGISGHHEIVGQAEIAALKAEFDEKEQEIRQQHGNEIAKLRSSFEVIGRSVLFAY